jgi:hypothetical protein
MYPAIDGVFLDQLCYQAIDYNNSDNRTSVNDKAAAEYGNSYYYNLEKLSKLLHQNNKFIWANGPFDIEIGRYCDGVMSEGTSGISETHKYLCLKKPLLIHTYPTDAYKVESMFRYILLSGGSYSYGGSSTLRNPGKISNEVEKIFTQYKYLADILLDTEILLQSNPFKLPHNCKGEIFQSKTSKDKFVTIVPNTQVENLDVVINIPHNKTAYICSNLDHNFKELTFKENTLTIPNNANAYLIKF